MWRDLNETPKSSVKQKDDTGIPEVNILLYNDIFK